MTKRTISSPRQTTKENWIVPPRKVDNRSTNHHADDDDERMIHRAEVAFVSNDYSTSLKLAQKVLQQNQSSSSSWEQETLHTSYIQNNMEYRLTLSSIDTTNNDSSTVQDRASAILLQSLVEEDRALLLDKEEKEYLQCFFEYYEHHPMPLTLVLLFLQFLMERKDTVAAFELGFNVVDCLREAQSSSSRTANDGIADDIVSTLVNHILPSCRDDYSRLLQELSQSRCCVAVHQWNDMDKPFNTYLSFLPAIENHLLEEHDGGSVVPLLSPSCLHECRTHVHEMIRVEEEETKKKKNILQLLPQFSNNPTTTSSLEDNKSTLFLVWKRLFSQFVHQRVIHPLWYSPRARQNLCLVVLSLGGMVWSRRRRRSSVLRILRRWIQQRRLTNKQEQIETSS